MEIVENLCITIFGDCILKEHKMQWGLVLSAPLGRGEIPAGRKSETGMRNASPLRLSRDAAPTQARRFFGWRLLIPSAVLRS
jgi:hypothetical protein